jgi:DNA (cytosine-5)-methyltransferase 1
VSDVFTVTARPVRVGALCAGYGGLELGLSWAGVDVDLTWYAEIDKHAAQVMGHHHPDVPNLGDLTEITDPPRVDVVTAGFPCQPVSTAGKRKGVNDERWLVEDVCRVAREAGADWLILENVAGLRSANGGDAMARVVSALAGNGFAAEWTSVRASDVGAPHNRLRWFCLAHADDGRRKQHHPSLRGLSVVGEDGAQPTADADLPGRGEQRGTVAVQPSCPTAEHAGDHVSRFGPYADAVARWEPIVGRPAPDPTDDKRRLNPRFVEWMMGLPDGWVTDAGVTRSQALKILGNGVVPQQAAFALAILEDQVRQPV